MPSAAKKHTTERRSEHLLNDLLDTQGWDRRRPPNGDVLFQNEYRAFPQITLTLRGASKTGAGYGVPEAILIDKSTNSPLAIVEAKPLGTQVAIALKEAQRYAAAFVRDGDRPLAIGLAGQDGDYKLAVSKWTGRSWTSVTYEGEPIGWIPRKVDVERLLAARGAELRPTVPSSEVLAKRASEINRLLRESNIKDEFRPAVVAAIMLALWQSGKACTTIRRDPASILQDINAACRLAFKRAGKPELSKSIRVDEANEELQVKARRITAILERLNVATLTAEHDYLGQLYEEFFRYTGGNTIGQYFTPRHIARFMADICEVATDDKVLDPACGTGGFLVACMDRMLRLHGLNREQMVAIVADHLCGFESEPVTAALCVANMILRGDGSTGIHPKNSFTSREFSLGTQTVVLMNPPFPHRDTDTPVEDFVDRALAGLARGGRLAAILPTSTLVKRSTGTWRERILGNNTLKAVCQLPDDLFLPFAATTTSIVLIEKGIAHNPKKKTAFVRLHHDGLVLRKNSRVARDREPNQVSLATENILNKVELAGFSAVASIAGPSEWAVGAYIASAPPEDAEVRTAVDELLRRLGSFYTRYAPEILAQRDAITREEINCDDYRGIISDVRKVNASKLPAARNTVGGCFEVYYGMKELHSREGMVPGKTLIISPTESYNGCYGWLDFDQVIKPMFVTVAQTGSIGEAFVQLEPCAVNDDCLVLLPKPGVDISTLVLAAATLHSERWRFSYGRKLTPDRIAELRLPTGQALTQWVRTKLSATMTVIEASLDAYR